MSCYRGKHSTVTAEFNDYNTQVKNEIFFWEKASSLETYKAHAAPLFMSSYSVFSYN